MVRPAAKLIILTLFLLALSTNAWAALVCNDTSGAIPGGATEVFRISGSHNAHAELSTAAVTYPIRVYCFDNSAPTPITLTRGNSGVANTVIQLSTPTNAHAEAPGQTNYTQFVSLAPSAGTMNVQMAGPGQTCNTFGAGYVPLIRLSRPTNAHVQSAYSYAGPDVYPYTICLELSAGGSSPQNIISMNQAPTAPIPAGGIQPGSTAIMNVSIENEIFPDIGNEYANMAVLQFSFICDVLDPTIGPSGKSCSNISTFAEIYAEMTAYINTPATTTIIQLDNTTHVQYYKDIGDTSTWDGLYSNYIANYGAAGANQVASIDGTQTSTYQYTIDPTAQALPAGNYRFISVSTPTEYDRVALLNQTENILFHVDNAPAPFAFQVGGDICGDALITGIEQCDPLSTLPNNGCNPGLACDVLACQCVSGGGTTGTAGDVFILRDIKFPNVYQNSDIVADVVVENKRMDLTTSGTISFIIRDSKGVLVPGFAPQNFSFSSSMETVRLTLQNPCSGTACAFNTGETYTLYATAEKFIDTDPNPPNLSETIIANNSGYKTFTTLEAPQTYSIPDSPWWMSVLVFGMIAGWLFISARKNEN